MQRTNSMANPRRIAFCTPAGPEVFSGIVHGSQIWTPDPFDVESIHADAREAFGQCLNRASSSEPPPHGKTLLLLGEAGSGKTHLMRAFRSAAHSTGSGYCGYLQMTSRTDNYARYLLSNLIDSLEQPYKTGHLETGLGRLARGIVDFLEEIPAKDRAQLSTDSILDPADAAILVHRLAYAAVQHPQFQSIDIDVIRGVLFVLANDPRLHALAVKWLRCEDLGKFDRELLGDLVPRPQSEMPLKTVIDLGRLAYAVHNAALVLLVDQIEQVIELDRTSQDRGEQFRFAVNTLVDIADGLPTAVVVIGCLEDLFTENRQYLPMPKLDRLIRDPEPIRLSSKRTEAEIMAMVALRLEAIFDAAGIECTPLAPREELVDSASGEEKILSRSERSTLGSADRIAPYTPHDLKGLVSLRPRDILDNLRQHRQTCFTLREWVIPKWSESTAIAPRLDWDQQWNDFHKSSNTPDTDDEDWLAQLLAFTIRCASAEMPNGTHFGTDPSGRFVPLEIHGPGNAVDKLYIAICNRRAQGGGLLRQVEEVARNAGEIAPIFVRSTDFPKDAKTVVSKEIAKLTAPRGKGRKVVVTSSDWRAMAAFREFHSQHHNDPGFTDWQRADRPLSELRSVHTILALDKLLDMPTAVVAPPTPAPPVRVPKEAAPPKPVKPPRPGVNAAPIRLGVTRSAVPTLIELQPKDLCRHAAFLGGSGSGKTTAALTIIEQLLMAGIPAVLLDRKGDLAQYADSSAWLTAEVQCTPLAPREELMEKILSRSERSTLGKLQAAIDVQLYTPGADAGRPLSIPIVPPDIGQLPAAELEQVAQFAANALATMMGYKSKAPDPKVVILQKGIEVLGRAGSHITVKSLQKLVDNQDDILTTAVDGYDEKPYKKLAQDLLTLAHQHRRLLEGGEPLNVDALLGRGAAASSGKTRLTIINTQFLGDPVTNDFWISQFLLAVDRWRTKNPAPEGILQAVFLFDEADQYLPALGKPASKGPMESLLKRARSAGIGIFLATQSPGDLDYKCRDQVLTWLIGRVKEPVAINKLKPMLEAGRVDAASKLPGQGAGQFYLVRESDVTPILVDRNLLPTAQLAEDRILAAAQLKHTE